MVEKSARLGGRLIEAMHGASCLAILKRNGQLSPTEKMFWNLASFAEISFLPIQPARVLPPTVSIDLQDVVEEYFLRYKRLEETFDALIDETGENRLLPGDIVVVTVGIDDLTGRQDEEGSGLLPIIHEDIVAEKVRELTCNRQVTVVVSAGNMGFDLDRAHLQKLRGFRPFHRRKYSNSGVECGAILVGAKDGARAWARSNKGSCIDAYGPGVIEINDETPNETGVPGGSIKRSDDGETILPDSLPLAWGDTSSAAMYIAAIIANVQQVRLIEGLDPLAPYSARAHLRQWRAREFGEGFEVLPTPDALAWLLGTGVLNLDDEIHDEYFLATKKKK